ncbi:uncharacterized protein RHOBADRAFT_50762 [Rhodotorula graminis WP1]|uniref:FHA domain-containing protein n=1 Tax=Rhodotorula graminis (strain WP1) TaxID=578459 RepID=A0A194SFC2_RHOGW|nr:uncharacterized protein RHOBADRAFT_50762 [Rhodotorula graminis WP1]KPV78276.1 hypothetical protein RHOBADRAFT_50762 [Rhodotorula graminis WP1]
MYLILSDPSTSPGLPVKQFDSRTAGRLILGRGAKSDSSALDPASPKFRTSATKVMSSTHAQLHWENEYAFLTDLGATNGTFLVRDGDQQKLKPDVPYRLFSDDRIIFGRPVTQRSHGSSPVVSQPLTLDVKLQPTPVLNASREPGHVGESPVRTALSRGNTVTEGTWRVGSQESSISDDEQEGSLDAFGGDDQAQRVKSSRRVSFVGLSQSSSLDSNDIVNAGQHDVEMTSSPSSSKRGFGLSEEDLLSSRESSPAVASFAPGPLSELDELQIEPTASEDAAVDTASVELMAITSRSHSPMDLDSNVARSPPLFDAAAKLDKLISTGLPSPVSPEFQLVAIASADEDQAYVDGDEADMPRSTNPSQRKVGRTLVYSPEVHSSGATSTSCPHLASAAPGPPEPTSFGGTARTPSPPQLSPALFGNTTEHTQSDSAMGRLDDAWLGPAQHGGDQNDEDDLLSQAASQLPSPTRSPKGFASAASLIGDSPEGSVEPLASEAMSSCKGEEDDGPEPPISSSPVGRRIATFFEELDDEDALIQAAERSVELESDSDNPPAAVKAPASPVGERVAAFIEELEEQHALVFEAEHTPDDIRVESYSDVEWSDRGEDDAREPMPSRSSRPMMSDDDDHDDDDDEPQQSSQAFEPCQLDQAAIASLARSPYLNTILSNLLVSLEAGHDPIANDGVSSPELARDAEAQSRAVDLSEGSDGSVEEESDGEEDEMDDDDDDDDEDMSEEEESEEEEASAVVEMSEVEESTADAPAALVATPVDEPAMPLIRPIGPSSDYLFKVKRLSARIVESDVDPDLDEGDQDLDQADLDLDEDAFDEEDVDAQEIDHPDGFDDDGAEWEDGVSEKLVVAADQAEQFCTIEPASHAFDKVSDSTMSPKPTSTSRKRRLSDTDLDGADPMPSLVKHVADFESLPIGVPKSAQTDFTFPATTSTSTVAVGTEPAAVVAPLPKRRRLDLPYKSFALGLVTGVVGAIAGLSALGSALEPLE